VVRPESIGHRAGHLIDPESYRQPGVGMMIPARYSWRMTPLLILNVDVEGEDCMKIEVGPRLQVERSSSYDLHF